MCMGVSHTLGPGLGKLSRLGTAVTTKLRYGLWVFHDCRMLWMSSGTSSVPDASSGCGLILNGIMPLGFGRLRGVVQRPSPDHYGITLDTLHLPLQVAHLCILWLQ